MSRIVLVVMAVVGLFSIISLAPAQQAGPAPPGQSPLDWVAIRGGYLVPQGTEVRANEAIEDYCQWTGPHYALAVDTSTNVAVVFCTDGSWFGGQGMSCGPVAAIGATMMSSGRGAMLYWEGESIVQISLR